MPSVTYISDIHLEFYKASMPFESILQWKKGDILCLAGDIGYPELPSYQAFLTYASSLFTHVFIIAGNHEYYQTRDCPHKTIHSVNNHITDICAQFPNVHFLNNTTYYMPEFDTYVLGTTLWSTTTGDHDELYTYNDFKKIHNMALPEYMDRLHDMSVSYVTGELEKLNMASSNSKIIVLTHHMPSYKLIHPSYKGSDINHLFATNLEKLMYTYRIDHWICGHSHTSMNITIHNTQLWMNPVGYPGEHQHVTWDTSFLIL